MIEIRNASVEFGRGVSPQEAEEIVTRALRLAAGMLPRKEGILKSLVLPSIEIAPGLDANASSVALANTLVRGITDAREVRND